ncbi:gamma-butyrolactone-binding regulator SlbR [Streptomyces marokkonensis]|uniref:Gamma-butyrolactone-binding regulator SlbR n=1 Tax=Streptomyces marokkonensis TaxID=324855 RepID=A0ABP7S0Q3_9ACTN
MSESTTQTATQLASQYSAQVTDDLERNTKEQERISAEITSAQQQLAALQHDHALLVNMQQALGITSRPARPATAPEPAATTEAATVPAPRDGATAEPVTGKRTRSGKTAAASKRTATAKPGAKAAAKAGAKPAAESAAKPSAKAVKVSKAVKKQAAKQEPAQARTTSTSAGEAPADASSDASPAKHAADRPTLVELVRTHLVEQSEPRSAAEVTTALGQAHSERTIKTTVVRTTLEGLVARNQAQRTKQGTSVYYTATDAPEAKQKQDAGVRTPSAQSDS